MMNSQAEMIEIGEEMLLSSIEEGSSSSDPGQVKQIQSKHKYPFDLGSAGGAA